MLKRSLFSAASWAFSRLTSASVAAEGKALAAHWYGQALDDVTGVEKIKVEKRLKELDELALSRDGKGVAASTFGAKTKGGAPSATGATKTGGPKSGKQASGVANANDQIKRSLAVMEWARTTKNVSVAYRFSGGTRWLQFGNSLPTVPFVILSVSTTNISDSDLKILEGLSTLETVSHSNGNTTGEYLKYLAASTELRELHIHNSGTIAEEYAPELKKFQRLQIVWLNANDPVGPGVFRAIASRPMLKTFSARLGPDINTVAIQELAKTPISELMLFGTNGEQVTALGNLGGLKKLYLYDSTAADKDLAKLQNHKQLAELMLTRASLISGSVFAKWQRCPLTKLTLIECSPTPEALTAVAKLPLLTNLRLANVRLTDDDASPLANARNLTDLDVSDTKIANWGFLKSMRLLKDVSLSGASISKELMQEFASRPLEQFQSWIAVS